MLLTRVLPYCLTSATIPVSSILGVWVDRVARPATADEG